jgi:hypothetical protein
MKNNRFSTMIFTAIFILVVFASFMSKKDIFEQEITNGVLKSSNILDINNEDLPFISDGIKNVNIFINNDKITFDKSNTITELDYKTINAIQLSDKTKWEVVTDKNENIEVFNNDFISLSDNEYNTLSFSFIYDNEEYNLSIIKDNDKYKLVKSNIKVIHGSINSLWYQYYYDLNTAIKAASNNDFIVLYDDIEVKNTITVDKNINILSGNNKINTIRKNKGYLFNVTKNNVEINITNTLLDVDSFIKGKYENNKVLLDNSKVVYKNKIYSNKGFKKIIKPSIDKTFIKASL